MYLLENQSMRNKILISLSFQLMDSFWLNILKNDYIKSFYTYFFNFVFINQTINFVFTKQMIFFTTLIICFVIKITNIKFLNIVAII